MGKKKLHSIRGDRRKGSVFQGLPYTIRQFCAICLAPCHSPHSFSSIIYLTLVILGLEKTCFSQKNNGFS
jgi:hypothetical protein